MIAVILSLSAANADFFSDRKKDLEKAVTPPSVNITVDLKKPLEPMKVEVKKDGVTVGIQPSPVPAPPVIQAEGNGFVANVINKSNELAQKPKNWIDQKGREINNGFIHLGNEIGMMWKKFKDKLFQDVFDWI